MLIDKLVDSTVNSSGFSQPSVHHLVYKDDFCTFANEIREELLGFPYWLEMRQDNYESKSFINPAKQNGLTTSHISDKHSQFLPNCLRFRDHLKTDLPNIAEIMGVDLSNDLQIELNGMAYGEGSWLSGHTDQGSTADGNDRIVAWMLYLTHPEDGEWSEDQGGAVRLWEREGGEIRLNPRFNRFAMFRVHKGSMHEIERIKWPTGWERCRLGLSGWVRGAREKKSKGMLVYMSSPDYLKQREKMEAYLQGYLAIHRLMVQQKKYCGVDATDADEKLRECLEDYEAHVSAPHGTSFLRRAPGPRGCITVLDAEQKIGYVGLRAKYEATIGASSSSAFGIV
jgi:Rps23 Pro-64 3,4-dihydroxylase Tpa1-like proline 4-hydroxylase